ncbi:hypothetical protein NDU88_007593 [Pleurodeles waltl]|uniref:Uncharacterized protein n=1 Tax=Pleurodeles waltl TaxID=8319 RepID=A0AAV7PLS6_PLEWA|nr:hypothetical protein NDU88_007593 [Pleurodeles waltl]
MTYCSELLLNNTEHLRAEEESGGMGRGRQALDEMRTLQRAIINCKYPSHDSCRTHHTPTRLPPGTRRCPGECPQGTILQRSPGWVLSLCALHAGCYKSRHTDVITQQGKI